MLKVAQNFYPLPTLRILCTVDARSRATGYQALSLSACNIEKVGVAWERG